MSRNDKPECGRRIGVESLPSRARELSARIAGKVMECGGDPLVALADALELERLKARNKNLCSFIDAREKARADKRKLQRDRGRKYGRQGSRERANDPEVQKRKQRIENALLKIDRRTPGQSVAEKCMHLCADGKLLNERGEPMNERTLANIYSKRNVARRKRAQ